MTSSDKGHRLEAVLVSQGLESSHVLARGAIKAWCPGESSCKEVVLAVGMCRCLHSWTESPLAIPNFRLFGWLCPGLELAGVSLGLGLGLRSDSHLHCTVLLSRECSEA